MEQLTGYKLEHCRLHCAKAVRAWNPLKLKLTKALDELGLEEGLNSKFKTLLYHHIPKICLAGCPNSCSQPQIKDFAVLAYLVPKITSEACRGCQACVRACLEEAVNLNHAGISIDSERCVQCGECTRSCPSGTLTAGENGWELRLGGRVGRHPRFAVRVGQTTADGEVVTWVTETLRLYLEQGINEERLSNFLDRAYKLTKS
ncbi:MAG: 4Fe-4S dicluster domain-containing protein [Desulfitobacteriaceae bacterium]